MQTLRYCRVINIFRIFTSGALQRFLHSTLSVMRSWLRLQSSAPLPRPLLPRPSRWSQPEQRLDDHDPRYITHRFPAIRTFLNRITYDDNIRVCTLETDAAHCYAWAIYLFIFGLRNGRHWLLRCTGLCPHKVSNAAQHMFVRRSFDVGGMVTYWLMNDII